MADVYSLPKLCPMGYPSRGTLVVVLCYNSAITSSDVFLETNHLLRCWCCRSPTELWCGNLFQQASAESESVGSCQEPHRSSRFLGLPLMPNTPNQGPWLLVTPELCAGEHKTSSASVLNSCSWYRFHVNISTIFIVLYLSLSNGNWDESSLVV